MGELFYYGIGLLYSVMNNQCLEYPQINKRCYLLTKIYFFLSKTFTYRYRSAVHVI